MNALVYTKELKKILSLTNKIIYKKIANPNLRLAKLVVSENKLTLLSTNLETWLETSIDAENTVDGEFLVNAAMISKIIQKTKRVMIIIESDGDNIRVNGMSLICDKKVEDFPEKEEVSGVETLDINSNMLSEIFNKTLFCMSGERTRYALNGLYIKTVGDKLFVAATDGRRLSVITQQACGSFCCYTGAKVYTETRDGIIIPNNFAMTVNAAIKKENTNVKFIFSEKENKFSVMFGDTKMTTKIIEGHFPDYEAVIPKKDLIGFSVNTEELRQIIDNLLVYADKDCNTARMTISKTGGKLSIKNLDTGEASFVFSIPDWDKEDLEKGFDIHLLADIFKVLNETIEIQTQFDAATAILIEQNNLRHVLMPLSLCS